MSNAANGGMLLPAATQMETVSGRLVDTFAPDAATIDPSDIAHHLSQLSRYGGATKRFYSVAEHAVLVYDLLAYQGIDRDDVLLAALLHDGAEAYLGDVISPLKYALRLAEFHPGAINASHVDAYFKGAYGALTERMDAAIAERFDLDPELFDFEAIKVADMWALRIEAAALTHSAGANWRWPGTVPENGQLPASVVWAGGLNPEAAGFLFHARLVDLGATDLLEAADAEVDRELDRIEAVVAETERTIAEAHGYPAATRKEAAAASWQLRAVAALDYVGSNGAVTQREQRIAKVTRAALAEVPESILEQARAERGRP